MASCQEGHAYMVAGVALSTNSTITNLATALFMTNFLVHLFYKLAAVLGAESVSWTYAYGRARFSGRETTSRIPLAFRARSMMPIAPSQYGG